MLCNDEYTLILNVNMVLYTTHTLCLVEFSALMLGANVSNEDVCKAWEAHCLDGSLSFWMKV